jgi:hypothetical protein
MGGCVCPRSLLLVKRIVLTTTNSVFSFYYSQIVRKKKRFEVWPNNVSREIKNSYCTKGKNLMKLLKINTEIKINRTHNTNLHIPFCPCLLENLSPTIGFLWK